MKQEQQELPHELKCQMLDQVPINVMFVDRKLVLRFLNRESYRTLRKVEHLLSVPVENLIGTCIDVFHKDPSVQRQLLGDPSRLPYQGLIQLGPETLDLHVTAVHSDDGTYVGAMATWKLVTDSERLRRESQELSESLATSASQISIAVNEISRNVHSTSDLAGNVEHHFRESQELFSELREGSRAIEDVVKVIQTTAAKTKLLALNAAIEAARAGEHGQGFSVVASEVKQLSTSTSEASEGIRQRIKTTQELIDKVVVAADHIAESVSDVRRNTSSIAAAVEEQSATMAELTSLANQFQSKRET